jgi:hypothetical protein
MQTGTFTTRLSDSRFSWPKYTAEYHYGITTQTYPNKIVATPIIPIPLRSPTVTKTESVAQYIDLHLPDSTDVYRIVVSQDMLNKSSVEVVFKSGPTVVMDISLEDIYRVTLHL